MKISARVMWIVCVALFVALAAFAGCAGNKEMAEGEAVQIEGGSMPSWVQNPEKASTDEEKAFIGVSRQYSMEQDARSDARRDAYRQAVEALGVYVKTKIDEVVSSVDMGNNILAPAVVRDELSRIQASGISIGEPQEYYIQKWQKKSDGSIDYYYLAYCRYMVPREYPKELMQNILNQEKAKLQDQKEQEMIDRALKKMDAMNTDDF